MYSYDLRCWDCDVRTVSFKPEICPECGKKMMVMKAKKVELTEDEKKSPLKR